MGERATILGKDRQNLHFKTEDFKNSRGLKLKREGGQLLPLSPWDASGYRGVSIKTIKLGMDSDINLGKVSASFTDFKSSTGNEKRNIK